MIDPGIGIGLTPVRPKSKGFQENFHSIIKAIATSSLFTSFIMFVIGVNAIIIGLETVEGLKETQGQLFDILDNVFLIIYTLEFFIKVYADSRGYWKSVYNIFDFVILALSFIQVIMDQLSVGDNILGVFRLLRALRTLRTISFIEGLQVLVTALIDTIRNSVLNVVILLALLMLFFAVVGYYIFGYDESGDKLRWGSLNDAMLTLFTFVTADGWTDIQKRLATNYPGSQWFTIVFIFLGHFIFTNLFIGIIIMNIHEATEKFLKAQRGERETQLKLKKEYLYKRQHDDVKQMLEKQKTSQYTNFEEMTNSYFETLRHDDYVIMKDVCTNLLWMESYIDSLDYLDMYMYRVQQCHRNLVLVLGEMAERHYKTQYGLLLADDLQDEYLPFPCRANKEPKQKSEKDDKIDLSCNPMSDNPPSLSTVDVASKNELPRKRRVSRKHHGPFSLPSDQSHDTLREPSSILSLRSQHVPSIIVVNEQGSVSSVVKNRIEDIMEADEDEQEQVNDSARNNVQTERVLGQCFQTECQGLPEHVEDVNKTK